MARFGLRALQPATWIARRWKSDEARGLFAGMAAHAISPLNLPTTGALGMMFGVFGHAYGWPVAIGGSASIASALESVLLAAGGKVETGHRVTELPDADVVLFDTSPDQVLALASHRHPPTSGPPAPALEARAGGLQGRPRGRGRHPLDERGGSAEPARCISAAPSRTSSPPTPTP